MMSNYLTLARVFARKLLVTSKSNLRIKVVAEVNEAILQEWFSWTIPYHGKDMLGRGPVLLVKSGNNRYVILLVNINSQHRYSAPIKLAKSTKVDLVIPKSAFKSIFFEDIRWGDAIVSRESFGIPFFLLDDIRPAATLLDYDNNVPVRTSIDLFKVSLTKTLHDLQKYSSERVIADWENPKYQRHRENVLEVISGPFSVRYELNNDFSLTPFYFTTGFSYMWYYIKGAPIKADYAATILEHLRGLRSGVHGYARASRLAKVRSSLGIEHFPDYPVFYVQDSFVVDNAVKESYRSGLNLNMIEDLTTKFRRTYVVPYRVPDNILDNPKEWKNIFESYYTNVERLFLNTGRFNAGRRF